MCACVETHAYTHIETHIETLVETNIEAQALSVMYTYVDVCV
jgi:hypothetical protein